MKIGFAFCGSFCNHPELLKLYEDIAREHEIVPILSENAAKYSTRFGTAEDFVTRVEALAGRKAVRNIVEAEPLGPQGAMEVLVIAPCTGNTLAKLAHGITDGAVTMAAKGHLRNGKPVVLAIATNDGLSASAPNIAVLLNRKNYYFVPLRAGQRRGEAHVADRGLPQNYPDGRGGAGGKTNSADFAVKREKAGISCLFCDVTINLRAIFVNAR